MPNRIRVLIPCASLIAGWLVGCMPATPIGPTLTPSPQTDCAGEACLGPTPTPTPAPTATPTDPPVGLPPGEPAPFPNLSYLRMVDQLNGWASDYEDKLYRTADGGASWYLVPVPPEAGINVVGSAFLDAAHAWLSYYDADGHPALLRTTDGGLSWTPLTGIGLDEAGGGPSFRFTSPEQGLAEVTGAGAGNLYVQEYETSDGGATFTVVPLVGPTPEPDLPEGTIHLCSLCLDSFYYDPYRAIIVEGDMGTMESRGGVHLKQTTDLGQTWTEMVLPLPAGYEDALAGGLQPVFPGGVQHGFLPVKLMRYNPDGTAAYDAIALYESIDAGQTWTLTPNVLQTSNPATLELVDDLDLLTLCGAAICASHDAALTWETVTPELDLASTDTRYVLDMTFVNPLSGWIILVEDGISQLYRTDDGGATWMLLGSGA